MAVKYRTKNIYRTIKEMSHNKTTNNEIVLFVLVLISIRRIKIAQTALNTFLLLFFLFFFLSSFEIDCEKIASEDDCFCFSSDFGAKFTPSCYRIANASGQAA